MSGEVRFGSSGVPVDISIDRPVIPISRSGGYACQLQPGWIECPCHGRPPLIAPARPSDNIPAQFLNIIPSKVPLSYDYAPLIPENKYYTLRNAVDMLEKQGFQIGMVLDLTKSMRYYRFERELPDAEARKIFYCKVPCRGKGQSPQPQAVNHAVFEIFRFLLHHPNRFILCHCTHGFNRTGYVIACALVRLFSQSGMTVERAVRRFAEARPPGIYKDGYLHDLFRYHHEKRNMAKMITPPVPSWKGTDGLEDEDDAGGGPEDDAEALPPPGPPGHDKIFEIGEVIHPEEAAFILGYVSEILLPERREIKFPGSQPVSLDRSNMKLIWQNRYWVTWKADGTRYMLLIDSRGSYLIDRSANVARVQMRFPSPQHKSQSGRKPDYPVGQPHFLTLLDGEMVVDHDKETGKYARRYLIYDVMSINGQSLVAEPFTTRYLRIEEEIVKPRHLEQTYIAQGFDPHKYLAPPLAYLYQDEPFKVRKKDFFPLHMARKLINQFIPKLSHEADGLILQPADDQYRPLTCHELLKWKFSHLNSVDFKLHVVRDDEGRITDCQLLLMQRTGRPGGQQGGPTSYTALEHVQVHFPEGVDPGCLDQRIIECTWSNELGKWVFLRVREDKSEPNAAQVYTKVVGSIRDDINDGELLNFLDLCFLRGANYERDRAKVPPGQMPEPPPEQPQPEQQQQPPQQQGEQQDIVVPEEDQQQQQQGQWDNAGGGGDGDGGGSRQDPSAATSTNEWQQGQDVPSRDDMGEEPRVAEDEGPSDRQHQQQQVGEGSAHAPQEVGRPPGFAAPLPPPPPMRTLKDLRPEDLPPSPPYKFIPEPGLDGSLMPLDNKGRDTGRKRGRGDDKEEVEPGREAQGRWGGEGGAAPGVPSGVERNLGPLGHQEKGATGRLPLLPVDPYYVTEAERRAHYGLEEEPGDGGPFHLDASIPGEEEEEGGGGEAQGMLGEEEEEEPYNPSAYADEDDE